MAYFGVRRTYYKGAILGEILGRICTKKLVEKSLTSGCRLCMVLFYSKLRCHSEFLISCPF